MAAQLLDWQRHALLAIGVPRALLTFVGFLALFKLQTVIEKKIRVLSPPVQATHPKPRLAWFKKGRLIIAVAASLEAAAWQLCSLALVGTGAFLWLLGAALRFSAIRALGPMWSFEVVRYVDHRLVRRGVYAYLQHPAYLGNVYLVGLTVMAGSPITALIALAFVTWFYLVRSRQEATMLRDLRS